RSGPMLRHLSAVQYGASRLAGREGLATAATGAPARVRKFSRARAWTRNNTGQPVGRGGSTIGHIFQIRRQRLAVMVRRGAQSGPSPASASGLLAERPTGMM